MESPNLHKQHHQLKHQHNLVGSSYISSPSGFCAENIENVWKNAPALFLNNIQAPSGEASSPNSSNNSMIQDMGFSLPNNNIVAIQSSSNQIKEESSTSSDHSENNSSLAKFSDPLNPSSTSPNEMLLLKTSFPTNYKNHMLHQPPSFQACLQYDHDNNNSTSNDLQSLGDIGGATTTFSQIFPSVNISNLSLSSPMDMNNLQGDFDPFVAARLLNGGSLDQEAPNSHLLQLFSGRSQYGFDDDGMQQSGDPKLCRSHNLFPFDDNYNDGVLESKRAGCIVEPKLTNQTSKKQRCEPRTPCPPLKVRKEKLGDRIAALQQMVAPFGKTDTASVLMEAIGYIKFLQNQVETLSVPYMNLAPKHRSSNNIQRMSNEHCETSEEDEKHADLRSRGLCLVPLSCLSYIECDPGINGGVWPPSSSFSHGF